MHQQKAVFSHMTDLNAKFFLLLL